jgi:hypothetical protein
MCSAARYGSSTPPAQPGSEVVWDRRSGLWRLTSAGAPLLGEDGEPLGWLLFSAAFDAKLEREKDRRPPDPQAAAGSAAEHRVEPGAASVPRPGCEAEPAPEPEPERPKAPRVGAWVLDTRTDRVGLVVDVLHGRVYLRKAGGGTEWEAMPVHLRPATAREELSARVAEINSRSRAGGP